MTVAVSLWLRMMEASVRNSILEKNIASLSGVQMPNIQKRPIFVWIFLTRLSSISLKVKNIKAMSIRYL